MNKSDLIEALKSETVLTRNEATATVNLFFDQISVTLASGDRVEIRGLCSFPMIPSGIVDGEDAQD